MQIRLIERFQDVSRKLIGPIKACKICFNNNNDLSLLSIVCGSKICGKCADNMVPIFDFFDVEGIKALSIFEYDEFFRNLIYQFKGCYDLELENVFLNKYLHELKFMYKGYTIVPAPSSKEDDDKRGFNHVERIFSHLDMSVSHLFRKEGNFKQADHNFKERKNIKKYIKLNEEKIENKRYLLVDDIYTTGSTMKTMLNLMKSKGASNIKILVLCRTKPKDYI